MPTSELFEKGFAITIAIVLLYDIIKTRRHLSARVEKLDDRYKNILEGLVKDAIRTNQELTAAVTHRPCMMQHEDQE